MPVKILVVDDEPDFELLIKQKLRKKISEEHLEIIFASNGLEALNIARKDPEISIVLTDINMPQMDGLTLLEKLGQLRPNIKTVIISAYGDMNNIRTAMNRGAFDFLTKPIDFSDLEKTINKTRMLVEQLQKAEEQERDLNAAWKIQQSILPDRLPTGEYFDIAASYIPMTKVGGDFYDYLKTEKELGILIADVSGHGVTAALIASMVKIAFSLQTPYIYYPKKVLEYINKILYLNNKATTFITAAYAYINFEKMKLILSQGGHPETYIYDKTDKNIQKLKPSGQVLGCFPDPGYQQLEINIRSGNRIIMITDGVLEPTNPDGEMFGEIRFERFIANNSNLTPQDFLVSLQAKLNDWVSFENKISFNDDLTVIVIDIK